ncbi:hypothetical protein DPEC_G00359700 [Dallia pectoralis]|uniref:Uncharacterized protein n=1 Tax=Dallia pectoralis TaxID=75939 RepID=A0ACC2F0K7_DALPE|nr:hypothetical protein DPEC_G00359700 [Dallia pectoralis]
MAVEVVVSISLLFQVLALIPCALSYVPPPVNVSVDCRNFHNVIYWNYSEPSLQPHFTVDRASMYSSQKSVVCANTSSYHCDVSSFTKHISDTYWIVLTAAVGPHRNKTDISFTYDDTMDSDVMCLLDFPPVNISAVSNEWIKVKFSHPFETYKNYPRTENMDVFKYTIVMENSTEHKFTCNTQECDADIPVVEMDRHCMSIDGMLGYVKVAPQKICTDRKPDSDHGYTALYIIIPVVGSVVLFFFLLMWLQKKLKGGFSTLPKSMLTNGFGGPLLTPECEILSHVQTDDSFPPDTPVTSVPTGTQTVNCTPQEGGGRFPIGVTGDEQYGGGEVTSNEVSGSSPDETIVLKQETENDFPSGYDSCHVPVVMVTEEISPGDIVTGYRT